MYLYSTKDTPLGPSDSPELTSILPPNSPPSSQPLVSTVSDEPEPPQEDQAISHDAMDDDIERILFEQLDEDGAMEEDSGDDDDDDDDENEGSDTSGPSSDEFPSIPVVLPRSRYAGICNVETVKDGESPPRTVSTRLNYNIPVNFFGPRDEFIVSGSDDGHFFVWDKATGKLHDILEGDGHVVNVVESHPHLPVLAVSGIDTTVKVSPTFV